MVNPRNLAGLLFCLGLTLATTFAAVGLVILYDFASHGADPAGRVTLRPGGGLLSLLVSATLLGCLFRNFAAAIVAAIVLAATALLVLAASLPLGATEFLTWLRPYLGSPTLAVVALVFAGSVAAVLTLRAGWQLALIGAGLMALAGTLSLLSWWLPSLYAFALGSVPEATVVLSPLIILTGLLLPGLALLRRHRITTPLRGLVLAGVVGIVVTTTIWHIIRVEHDQGLTSRAELLANQIRVSSETIITDKVALIRRLAYRWQLMNGFPERDFWEQEVESYLGDFPELQLIGLLDDRYRPVRIHSRDLTSRFWLHQFRQLPATTAWLNHVAELRAPHVSTPLQDDDGNVMALIAVPILTPAGSARMVIAAIDLQQLYRDVLQFGSGGLHTRISWDDTVVFDTLNRPGLSQQASPQQDSQQQPTDQQPPAIRSLAIIALSPHHDTRWQVLVYLPAGGTPDETPMLSLLVLFTGLGLSFLLMLSQFFWRESEDRAGHLLALNDSLNFHLEQERNLRTTNERIMEFSKDMLCSISQDGLFTMVSPACRDILGYAPEELIGQPYDILMLEEDRVATAEQILRLQEAGEMATHGFRNRHRHRDGQVVTLSWTAEWSAEDDALFCVGRDISAELTAEILTRERDQFFSLSPDMFCIVDLNSHFFELNDAFVTELGFGREELIGTSYLDLVITEDRPAVLAAVQSLIEGHSVRDLFIRVQDRAGAEHWLEVSATLSSDDLIYVVARDITAIRQTQQQLAQSEALLKIAETAARIGGWMLDVRTGESTWSDVLFEIHELPIGEAPPLNDGLFYYLPESLERISAAVERCKTEGIPFDEELQLRTAKGRLRWVRAIGHAVCDQQGKIIRLQGGVQDITASREALEQIRRMAERQATIFESITDAFFTLDTSWCFTYVNQRSEELLQRSREDLLGRCIWDEFPAAVGSEFEHYYRHAVASGESVSFEAYYAPLNNWLEISAYPSEEGLAVYYRSIWERKLAEKRLQDTLAELERSNRELQDFAFVASHDLQEPLRKIQAFSDRLLTRSEQFGEQEQDYLRRMQSAANRMQTLIQDLLSYSRVTTRARPFVSCDTNTLLAEVLQDLETAISREQATVETQPLPAVTGDPVQLRQVLQNLLSNAVKFHKKDQKPQILVYAENETPDGWTLVVSDNGIGFDEKYADKLFHPFQRLHQRQDYAGTGIGMAIVKKILERHDARITVASQPDEGTTFRVRFHQRPGDL